MKLKPLKNQVMVITGASSGMGLATARLAARHGARLVLVARNEKALQDLAAELSPSGKRAIAVTADVTHKNEVEQIAKQAIEHFGGFDTWVNIAGLTTYGTFEEVDLQDHRRIFELNYWGTVYGSMTAVKHLRQHGGALINMGSVMSDMTVAYQGSYCSSKHAVKAFTNALRIELETTGAPISVSLIKPTSIDTPLRHHGKDYFSQEPQNPPPAYAPELVAQAVLHCAQSPRREIMVGGAGRLLTFLTNLAPRLAELFMGKAAYKMQTTQRSAAPKDENSLYSPDRDGAEHGGTPFVLKHSLYTHAMLKPGRTTAVGISLGALAIGTWMAVRRVSTNRATRRRRNKKLL